MVLAPSEYQQRYALLAVSLGVFCVQLDSFALNLALPDIGAALGADSGLSLTVSAYLLTVGVLMPVAGRASDLLGRKRLLRLGILLFGAGSALCGAASSLPFLVVSRVVQGAGGALIMPVGIAFVTQVFSEEARGRALGRALGAGGIATACGPFVGGVLTEFLSWPAVFWINVPVCLAAAWSCRRAPEVHPASSSGRCRLTRDDAPVSGRFLLRNRQYVVLTLAGSVANAATVVFLFIIPLWLHNIWGLSSLGSGITFLLPSLAMTVAGPLAGRVRASDAKAVMSVCLACSAGGLCGLAWSPGFVTYFLAMSACGGVLGLANAVTLVGTQSVVTADQAGTASGITKTAVTISGGLGVGVVAEASPRALTIGVLQDTLVSTAVLCCGTAVGLALSELWGRRRVSANRSRGRLLPVRYAQRVVRRPDLDE